MQASAEAQLQVADVQPREFALQGCANYLTWRAMSELGQCKRLKRCPENEAYSCVLVEVCDSAGPLPQVKIFRL